MGAAAAWRAGSLLLQSMSRSCTQPGPVATNTTCFAGLFSHRLSGYCGNSMAISWAILSRVRRDWTLAEVAALVRCWTGQSPRLPVGFPMSVFTEIPTTVTAAELERLEAMRGSRSASRQALAGRDKLAHVSNSSYGQHAVTSIAPARGRRRRPKCI